MALRAGTEGHHGLGAHGGRLLAQSQQQETQSQTETRKAPQEKAASQPPTSFRGVLIIAGISSHPNQYSATCLVSRVTPLYQQPSLHYLRVSVLHTHTQKKKACPGHSLCASDSSLLPTDTPSPLPLAHLVIQIRSLSAGFSGVTGEELTCTLDQEIHHLNSVKINHHSSAAEGSRRKTKGGSSLEATSSALQPVCERGTLPSSGGAQHSHLRQAPLRHHGRDLGQAPGASRSRSQASKNHLFRGNSMEIQPPDP